MTASWRERRALQIAALIVLAFLSLGACDSCEDDNPWGQVVVRKGMSR